MHFRLVDDCKIIYDTGGEPLENAIYRQNGGTGTISVPEYVSMSMTLSDGSEVHETRQTGRTLQIDRITDIDEKAGRTDGEFIVTGYSDQLIAKGLPEEQTVVTFRVIPGPGCRSCGGDPR